MTPLDPAQFDASNAVRLCESCESECGVSAGADAGDRACSVCGQHEADNIYPGLAQLDEWKARAETAEVALIRSPSVRLAAEVEAERDALREQVEEAGEIIRGLTRDGPRSGRRPWDESVTTARLFLRFLSSSEKPCDCEHPPTCARRLASECPWPSSSTPTEEPGRQKLDENRQRHAARFGGEGDAWLASCLTCSWTSRVFTTRRQAEIHADEHEATA